MPFWPVPADVHCFQFSLNPKNIFNGEKSQRHGSPHRASDPQPDQCFTNLVVVVMAMEEGLFAKDLEMVPAPTQNTCKSEKQRNESANSARKLFKLKEQEDWLMSR